MVVNGCGFFQVLLLDGIVFYICDGSFYLNFDGQIVIFNGFVLELVIVVFNEIQIFIVGQDGIVLVIIIGNVQLQVIGNIQIVDFINLVGLQVIGNNLFLEIGFSGVFQVGMLGFNGFGMVVQNILENFNVNVVEELVNMIIIQCVYEMNFKVIFIVDQMLFFVIQNF